MGKSRTKSGFKNVSGVTITDRIFDLLHIDYKYVSRYLRCSTKDGNERKNLKITNSYDVPGLTIHLSNKKNVRFVNNKSNGFVRFYINDGNETVGINSDFYYGTVLKLVLSRDINDNGMNKLLQKVSIEKKGCHYRICFCLRDIERKIDFTCDYENGSPDIDLCVKQEYHSRKKSYGVSINNNPGASHSYLTSLDENGETVKKDVSEEEARGYVSAILHDQDMINLKTCIENGLNQAFAGSFGLIDEYFRGALSIFPKSAGCAVTEGYSEFKSNNSFEECAIQDTGFVEKSYCKDKINNFNNQ